MTVILDYFTAILAQDSILAMAVTFLATVAMSIVLGRFTIAWLNRQCIQDGAPRKASDTLNEMNKKKARTPTMGGLFIMATTFLAALAALPLSGDSLKEAAPAFMCLAAMLGSAALGAFDDWAKLKRKGKDGIPARAKLAGQVSLYTLCAIGIWAFTPAEAQTLWVPILDIHLHLGWLMMPLGVFVMTGASNAVNLSDGLDGLAGGMTVMVALVFAAVGLVATTALGNAPHGQSTFYTGTLSIIVAASVLGFLYYNRHPAKVFMGDTGSLALGAGLGAIAMALRVELLLAVAGIVFVAEAMSVMMQVGYFKLSGGKRIFKCAPLHHHFQFSGWNETKVTRRFWAATAMACMVALAMAFSSSHFKAELPTSPEVQGTPKPEPAMLEDVPMAVSR